MPRVQIYTTQYCPYCLRAKALLAKKGVAFEEIDITDDDAKWDWLAKVTGQQTVPQVFVGGRSLGGFSDIDALDQKGQLDPLLRGDT